MLISAMFDTQNNGSVDIQQFNKMFEYINQWLNIFKTYDRNASGLIDDQELNQGTLKYLEWQKLFIAIKFIWSFFLVF